MYQQQQSYWIILSLSLCSSLLFLSRYHALLWLAPIIVINLAFIAYQSRNFLFWHFASYFIIAFSPIGLFLLKNYLETGYLTGAERFDWASRNLPKSMDYFEPSTSLKENIIRTIKTYWLDFGSPNVYATHAVTRQSYFASGVEIGGVILFFMVVGILIMILAGLISNRNSLITVLCSWQQNSLLTLLSIEFFVWYIIVTLVLWTVGNNDPLYTRFLYPSYIYFLLTLLSGYSYVKRNKSAIIYGIPFVMFFLYLLFVNLYKITNTIILHNRLPA
jgi:hypothetical protein